MPDLGRGNADSYVGLRINFVPHHHPYLIMFDENGAEPPESQWTDLSKHDFEGLTKIFADLGFRRKELL
eukprot:CAMPEP_0169155068 /NCGR_PEP_ID=MMETSP1015-20121227/53116_1 /TAXON_ID=342587 /ORGANISM="Karlodinium micrum, Strain CCMP2283" /LENGTH=68 /DNA_ID=CAMNT_0009225437 /DNA_START=302 /DNA_END=504 /DNA_ORIENTATION=-